MRKAGQPWLQGAIALAVLGAMTAAILISPVGAAPAFTRAKATKLIKTLSVLQGESAYAENDPAPDIDLSGTLTPVVSVQLQLSSQRRVFASGIARVRSVGANANGATCDVSISGQDGLNSGENTPETANYDLTLSAADSAVVGAGTHTVSLRCQESAPDIQYLLGELLVWTA